MRRVAGIDVGGTFTDLVLAEIVDGVSRIHVAKVPTSAGNQAQGVIAAIRAAGFAPAEIDLIVHGTTATTNAVLERKIARVGLITTEGFRDILELGRRTRPKPYGMTGTFEPLISREHRREVPERMNAAGEVVTPIDEDAVAREIRFLVEAGCEALVIHFLHAYANPSHELAAGAVAKRLWPNSYVTLGHALLSEFREYERGTTASVNAAVQPILDRYVQRLQTDLAAEGHDRDVLVMNGNGGTAPARTVALEAARTVMSGPASGVMAAAATLAQAGVSNAITYDMGGTSTDVALIHGGAPAVAAEQSIAYGLPIHLPMVDVRTVGAGGGSIISVDGAGMLKVGPESAGSAPGPIAYGRGGRLPTITDANVVLGRLDPASLTAVDGAVDIRVIRDIFDTSIAAPLGLTIEEAASAAVTLANVHMSGTIRMVSLARGHDPRDFVLFAFGGAGPLHAVALARELGVPEVFVPARPGLTNALGCLVADLRQDRVRTVNVPLDVADMETLSTLLASQEADCRRAMVEEASEIAETDVFFSADMQFRGQTHLVRVALPSAALDRGQMQKLFEAAYFARFQVSLPEIRAAIVNLNTSVVGLRRQFDLTALAPTPAAGATVEAVGRRLIHADGAWRNALIYDRLSLPRGTEIAGPAVLTQMDATTIIEPGAIARVDAGGNVRIRL